MIKKLFRLLGRFIRGAWNLLRLCDGPMFGCTCPKCEAFLETEDFLEALGNEDPDIFLEDHDDVHPFN